MQLIGKGNGDGNVGNPQHTPAQEHGIHGYSGFACAPENTGGTVGEGKQEEEQANGAAVKHAVVNDLRAVVKQPDELGGKKIKQPADTLSHHHGADNGENSALFHPVILLCAQVLTHEGSQGLAEAGNGQEGKALNFGVGAAACHGSGAEGIDVGLHHHIGKTDHGILNTGGQAKADDVHQAVPVNPNPPGHQLTGPLQAEQTDAAKQGADSLGNGGGESCGAHAHVQYTHKKQIQHHIHDGRENQIVKGMAAVSHGVENTHKDIVHDGKNCTAEVKPEIFYGILNYICRCPHPPKNGWGKDNAQHGQQAAANQAEGDVCMNGQIHFLVVLGSVVPGDDNAGTHGQAVEKAYKQENEITGGADGGQSLVSKKLSHNQRVDGVVELLKYISPEDRQSKANQRFGNGILHKRIVLLFQCVHFLYIDAIILLLYYAIPNMKCQVLEENVKFCKWLYFWKNMVKYLYK